MRVRATQNQIYGERYRRIGEVFDVRDADFTPSCMHQVGIEAATLADNPDRREPIALSEMARGEGSLEAGKGGSEETIFNGKPVKKGKGTSIKVDGKAAKLVGDDGEEAGEA